jgi:hypothetical protein
MRNDLDAMRAKNEVLETENRNLRQKLEEQAHPKEKFSFRKFFASAWNFIKTLWELAAAFGWAKIGGMTAIPIVIALVAGGYRSCNEAYDRYMTEARADAFADELEREAEAAEAHRLALENMRRHTPRGVDPTLWTWCIDHCANAHSVGAAIYAEGIVTAIDHGFLSSDLINIEGPWLYMHYDMQRTEMNGTRYRITEFGDIPIGSLVGITYRQEFPQVIESIDIRDSEYMREHPEEAH